MTEPRLVCTADYGFGPSIYPVTVHTRPIFDLLKNGVNTEVILVKRAGGIAYTYRLATPEELAAEEIPVSIGSH